MAGDFEVLAGESTVELIGATDVQDVYQVTARALPSGVVYHVRFPPAINDPESIRVILGEWATQYNALVALPGVVGVSTLQDVDAAGQISDVTDVTVRSNSGRLSSTVEIKAFSVVDGNLTDLLAEAVVNLNKIEEGR